jgi:hypothetical protein
MAKHQRTFGGALGSSQPEPDTEASAVAAESAVEPVAAVVPSLWVVSTMRQPTLTVSAVDVTAAKQRYADLLGVTWFGNPVDIEAAPAGAVESVWPPKE